MSRTAPLLLLIATIILPASPTSGEDWPQWRGPRFDGSARAQDLPVDWSDGKNVAWTLDLPGQGGSTPVVAGKRIFLTSVVQKTGQLVAVAVDLETGRRLWSAPCGENPIFPGGNTGSSPSAVTDGKRVWFLLGTGKLYAFSVEGDALWTRDIAADHGPLTIKFGFASSPLLLEGKLYIPVLRNRNPHRYKPRKQRPKQFTAQESFLLAIDARTGKDLWKHVRLVPSDVKDESTEGYITPIPVTHEGNTQIILAGGEHVTAHDGDDGRELWRWAYQPEDRKVWQRQVCCPTPGQGKVFVTRPQNRPLFALGLDPGRVPDAHRVVWQHRAPTSDVSAPLLYGSRLYVVDGKRKVLCCLDPQSGELLWQEKLNLKGPVRASPLGADGKVYLISKGGTVLVFAAGDTPGKLASFEMGEDPCHSGIVAVGHRLLVRTARKLYCIRKQ
jgi:outer membrane protein assembly factor BamB